jgi:hypothetical protein
MGNTIITKEFFIKRLSDLCARSGMEAFPKDEQDQHILLKSIVLELGDKEAFAEVEINERIKYWLLAISRMKKVDHSTLRRWLVDAGYLMRTPNGSRYEIARTGPSQERFAPEVEEVNVTAVVEAAREEIARRKREYLAKQ